MTETAVKRADAPAPRRRINYLPYLLSLPALLVCVGILIPFVTAVYYSLQRYRLNLPTMRGFIWFQNYIDFLNDREFWHTVQVSLEYTVLTVGDRARVRPRHRHASAEADPDQQHRLHPSSSAADDGAGDRGAHVEIDDQPELRRPLLFRTASRRSAISNGRPIPTPRCSPSSSSTSGSTRPSS